MVMLSSNYDLHKNKTNSLESMNAEDIINISYNVIMHFKQYVMNLGSVYAF